MVHLQTGLHKFSNLSLNFEGQFPPGSMGPKIESALRFLEDGGELAVITSPALLAATLAGHGETAGTRIERAASQSGQAR